MRPLIAYYRVNSSEGASPKLGIDAQREIIASFAAAEGFEILAEFAEFGDVETGKDAGALEHRPQLAAALAKARNCGKRCPIAVVGLDRLSNDVAFIASLMRKRVPFISCESGVNAVSIILTQFAVERRRKIVSDRTKAALAAAKGRGNASGNPRIAEARAISSARLKADADAFAFSIAPLIKEAHDAGAQTLTQIAKALNSRGITTARGGQWQATTVANILNRIGADSDLTREIFFKIGRSSRYQPADGVREDDVSLT